VYFRAPAFLKASVTAILFRRLLSTQNTNNSRKGWRKNVEAFEYQHGVCFGIGGAIRSRTGGGAVGNAGAIEGVVKDSSGGVVPGAKVEISYAVSGYQRETTTGSDGSFRFSNVPFNTYHLVVTTSGFAPYTQDVDVRSSVPTGIQIALKLGTAATSITVEANGGDLLEKDPSFHTDVDTGLTDRMPLESQSSSVSSLVTLATPGVVADSNGLFHGLGDHAENSFSVDGQPITDQQSKVFSNQIPLDSIQSLEAVSGGPPAEYGGKTSLVIKVTTQSGLGVTKPKVPCTPPTAASARSAAAFGWPLVAKSGETS